MTVSKKHRIKSIAILSVLKPVNDVRAYQKIAKSILIDSNDSTKITLIGFEASSNFEISNPNIDFIELFTSKKNTNRLGLWRFFAGFKVFNQLLKIRPSTIIVCAVKLLPFALLFKLLSNSKLIYDVQENYAFNILYQNNYPTFLKKTLAFLIRSFEKLSSPFIDLYFLAEKCYVEEMPYLKKTNYIFLENKFLIENSLSNNFYTFNYLEKREIKFLMYGSFSKTYGTLEGVLFFKKLEKELQKHGFSVFLVLAGYCSDTNYSKKIIEITENQISILRVNEEMNKPLSHQILLHQLQKTDFVILPYLLNKSTQNCIPTKIYECLAYQKPMLISENPKWKMANGDWGIEIENWKLENEIQIIAQKILSQQFYTQPIDEKIWKFDREIIRKVI